MAQGNFQQQLAIDVGQIKKDVGQVNAAFAGLGSTVNDVLTAIRAMSSSLGGDNTRAFNKLKEMSTTMKNVSGDIKNVGTDMNRGFAGVEANIQQTTAAINQTTQAVNNLLAALQNLNNGGGRGGRGNGNPAYAFGAQDVLTQVLSIKEMARQNGEIEYKFTGLDSMGRFVDLVTDADGHIRTMNTNLEKTKGPVEVMNDTYKRQGTILSELNGLYKKQETSENKSNQARLQRIVDLEREYEQNQNIIEAGDLRHRNVEKENELLEKQRKLTSELNALYEDREYSDDQREAQEQQQLRERQRLQVLQQNAEAQKAAAKAAEVYNSQLGAGYEILRGFVALQAGNALRKAWSEAVDYVKEYNDALTEIRIVSGMDSNEVEKMGER